MSASSKVIKILSRSDFVRYPNGTGRLFQHKDNIRYSIKESSISVNEEIDSTPFNEEQMKVESSIIVDPEDVVPDLELIGEDIDKQVQENLEHSMEISSESNLITRIEQKDASSFQDSDRAVNSQEFSREDTSFAVEEHSLLPDTSESPNYTQEIQEFSSFDHEQHILEEKTGNESISSSTEEIEDFSLFEEEVDDISFSTSTTKPKATKSISFTNPISSNNTTNATQSNTEEELFFPDVQDVSREPSIEEELLISTQKTPKNTKKSLSLSSPSMDIEQELSAQQSSEPPTELDSRKEKIASFYTEIIHLYNKWFSSANAPMFALLRPEVDTFIARRIKDLESVNFDNENALSDWLDSDFIPFLDKVMDTTSLFERAAQNDNKTYQIVYQEFHKYLFTHVNSFCREQKWFLLENITIGTLFNPRDHQGAGSEAVETSFFNKIIYVKKLGLMNLTGIQRIRKAHVIVGN